MSIFVISQVKMLKLLFKHSPLFQFFSFINDMFVYVCFPAVKYADGYELSIYVRMQYAEPHPSLTHVKRWLFTVEILKLKRPNENHFWKWISIITNSFQRCRFIQLHFIYSNMHCNGSVYCHIYWLLYECLTVWCMLPIRKFIRVLYAENGTVAFSQHLNTFTFEIQCIFHSAALVWTNFGIFKGI